MYSIINITIPSGTKLYFAGFIHLFDNTYNLCLTEHQSEAYRFYNREAIEKTKQYLLSFNSKFILNEKSYQFMGAQLSIIGNLQP